MISESRLMGAVLSNVVLQFATLFRIDGACLVIVLRPFYPAWRCKASSAQFSLRTWLLALARYVHLVSFSLHGRMPSRDGAGT
jgi:hypothetical protein